MVLNNLGVIDKTKPMARVLATPPPRLRIKAGPRNVPVNNEERITLIR